MSDYSNVIKRHYTPYLQSLKDDYIARKNKEFFWPSGVQVYVGRQGSGKTISAVYHTYELKQKYPKAIIVTNLNLSYLKPINYSTIGELRQLFNTSREGVEGSKVPIWATTHYIRFTGLEQLSQVLAEVNNDFYGVIYIIDEIHLYFNSLDSKNIPIDIFTQISQQRKQRKVIVGSSQLFNRMAKPFREQADHIIFCKTRFNVLTTQRIYNGDQCKIDDITGEPTNDPKKKAYFWHNRHIRNLFDTYQIIITGQMQQNNVININTDQNPDKKTMPFTFGRAKR